MTDQTSNKTPNPSRVVDVSWAAIEPGLATYANNLIALFDGKSIHVTFAQINPPIILGKNEKEKQERLDEISSVIAMPVARLVIPLDNFRTMLQVLQEQLGKIDALPKP